jgi:HSA
MSSSRNKRKRTDADLPSVSVMETNLASTQRTSAALGDEPTAETERPKNEGGINNVNSTAVVGTPTITTDDDNDNDSSNNNNGEPGTASEPQQHQQQEPNDAQAPPAVGLQGPNADPAQAPAKPKSAAEGGEGSAHEQTANASVTPPADSPAAQATRPHHNVVSNGQSPQEEQQLPQLDYISKRESQLKSMLAHRKLLLDRTQCSRSAVRSRIYVMAISDPRSAKLACNSAAAFGEHLSTVSGNSALTATAAAVKATITKPVETAKDKSEIAAFKRLGRMALLAAKKPRTDGTEAAPPTAQQQQQDKRSSLSLRRGSSVGKKLNSVISSLVPASATVIDGSTPAQPLHLPIKSHLAILPTVDQQTAILSPAKNVISPFTATTALPNDALQPASLPMPENHASRAFKQTVAYQQQVTDPVSKIARNTTQRTAVPNVDVVRTTFSTLSSGTTDASTGMPPSSRNNRLERVPVVFQQAIALRDRRNTLLAQLEKTEKRHAAVRQSPASRTLPRGKTDGSKATFKSLRSPAKTDLPHRRRTHWDNILEEMKWLATDYIEERKWKIAAARSLGASAMEPGANSAKPASERATNDNFVVAQVSTRNGDSSDATPKPDSSVPIPMPSLAKAYSDAKSPADDLFTTPSNDDNTSRKAAAKTISMKVQEYGCVKGGDGSVSMTRSNETASGSRESQYTQSAVVKPFFQTSEGRGATDMGMNGNEGTHNSAPEIPQSKPGSFARISDAIQALLEKINRPDAKSKRKHGEDGRKMSLLPEQQEVIDFIEDKWSNGAGAILKGSRASGKTISVCALLRRRQEEGPHLVVCSNLRVVCFAGRPV